MTTETQQKLGEMILETLREFFSPEDVFGYDRLAEWAIENGFTEPEPEPFTLDAEFDRGLIKK